MDSRRLAFLILAHTDPQHIGRLCKRLLPYGAVFVHIDGKRDLRPFLDAAPEGAVYLRNRVRVTWGGFSIVRATLNLIEEALRSAPDARRFVLLSGQDYPIRPLDDLVALFEKDPLHEYVRAFRMTESDHHRNQVLNYRHLNDVLPFAPKGALGKAVFQFNRLIRRIDRETGKRLVRRYPFPLIPAYGSQWWALTREAVEHIVDFLRRNPRYVRFYRNTFAPDEHFFQTIVHGSPQAANTEGIEPYGGQHVPDMANLHLIDAALAEVYTLEDLETIRSSGRYFARKVTTERSTPLLDRLDELDAPKR